MSRRSGSVRANACARSKWRRASVDAAKLAQEHAAGSFGVGIAGEIGQRGETGRRAFGTTNRDGARQRDHG